MWIHYIGGLGKGDKLVVVAIGLSDSPEEQVAALRDSSPFKIILLGLEEGSTERLEDLRKQFKGSKLRGPWYKATNGIQAHVKALKPVKRGRPKPKRISLDLSPEEFRDLEEVVTMLGCKTKSRFLRRATRFYTQIGRLKAQGWMFQAVRGGKLLQFPDIDADIDTDEST